MELRRNIVPILVNDFRFDDNARVYLTGRLRDLSRYNGLGLPHDYFDAAMERLRTRFLKLPGQGGITPAPHQDASVVQQKIEEATSQPAPTKQELSAEDYFNRAMLYHRGEGVAQDYQQARQWFEKAAAAGNIYGMSGLGELYRDGEGVAQDYQQARQWYEKAAAAGETVAMQNLGVLYREGQGVSQDYQQARQWYEKAVAAGNTDAMSGLGWLYEAGLGVSQDYQQARQWYEKAAAHGNEYAKTRLQELRK
jgi:TPR repeat protein